MFDLDPILGFNLLSNGMLNGVFMGRILGSNWEGNWGGSVRMAWVNRGCGTGC